jgi:tetratricopeptide (TPR) repeat protein
VLARSRWGSGSARTISCRSWVAAAWAKCLRPFAPTASTIRQSRSKGYATVGVVERFRAERQILAGLEHPNIALSPSDPLVRVQQAGVEIILGDAFLKLGDRSQTLPHYQRALDLLDPLVRRGDNLIAAFNTAVLHGKTGDVALIEGRTSQAVPEYEDSLRIVSRLAAAGPLNASMRQQEAVSLVSLGHALTELGRGDDGVRYARRALARLDANASSTPLVRSTEVLIRGWLGEALERQASTGQLVEALRQGGDGC